MKTFLLFIVSIFFYSCGNSGDESKIEKSTNSSEEIISIEQGKGTIKFQIYDKIFYDKIKFIKIIITGEGLDSSTPFTATYEYKPEAEYYTIGDIVTGNKHFVIEFYDLNNKLVLAKAGDLLITENLTSTFKITLNKTDALTFGRVMLKATVNYAPKIYALTFNKLTVKPGEVIKLKVFASDRENEQISYAWTSSDKDGFPAGTFTDPTVAEPEWTAPAAYGTYSIKITTADINQGESIKTLNAIVSENRGNDTSELKIKSVTIVWDLNGNKLLELGDKIDYKIEVENIGTRQIPDSTGIIQTPNSYATLSTNNGTLPAISPGASAFFGPSTAKINKLSLASNFIPGETINLDLNLTDSVGATYRLSFDFKVY